MPGKRIRKDSEKSIGSSSGTPSGPEMSSGSGGGSSSGSVDSECEEMKPCCFPNGCPQGENSATEVSMMVKVICSFDACPISPYMHAECFTAWEEGILSYLRSHGRARSWSEKQRRQNLWTKRGYDLAYRACICKCKHGHLRKDIHCQPQASNGMNGDEAPDFAKKKNRKKHKDLPSLGAGKYATMTEKSKSKPIPDNNNCRIRHHSTSSTMSVDQGYNSASPSTTDVSPYMFSPPSQHHRSMFNFHPSQIRGQGGLGFSNGFHAPSTSPLPEIPDDVLQMLSPQTTPSPTSTDMSPPPGVFSPPLSPEGPSGLCGPTARSYPGAIRDIELSEIQRVFPKAAENQRPCTEGDILAMTQLIDNLWRNGSANQRLDANATPTPSIPVPQNQYTESAYPYVFDPSNNGPMPPPQSDMRSFSMPKQLANGFLQQPCASSFPGQPPERYPQQQIGAEQEAWHKMMASHRRDVINAHEHAPFGALRHKEQKDAEKREMNKYILSMMTSEEKRAQVISIPNEQYGANGQPQHTEIRLVPMRSTTFKKRYDFSAFQKVLPRQHVNPYRIKMEGEGYGSDDLRNFILASLSLVKCAQMNCVVCGTDMPIYDHFPLVDGTMFLSPVCNGKTEKNCFKIKVEGKHEFVHAACTRCLEGLHTIVCRLCDARWEGTHHQLGTLYMYDIFAANPCCQRRLCCKGCGSVVVDIRSGLKFYSDYSKQQTCPQCGRADHHFIHPADSYQLMGLVLS